MAHLAEGVWRDVLDEIQREIGEHQFYSWFKNLGLRSYDRDSATLTVPNLFTRDWVSGKYCPLIQSAFERVTGQAPRILFEVDPASAVPLVSPPATEKAPPRPSSFISEVQLNSNYSFSQFVVGPSNRLPHAASVAVAENPANAYNPLFLHGAVGLGKTHLLQAICHELLARRPDMRILYLSCESFVNQFIAAIQRGELVTFRYRYRHIDALVIDDIHFLANKEQTQEEFFHTFNTLHMGKKQIVLSSDSPPSEIPTLEHRLVSRFKTGLVTKIEPPVFETRLAILRQKSRTRNLEISDDVLHYIAERVATNIRELEGAINILSLEARALQTSAITIDFAKTALREFLPSHAPTITVSRIIDAVVDEFGLKFTDLQSKKRAKSIAFPRQICMYLAKKLTNSSLEEIGSYLGGRDHSTVIYAVDKIQKSSATDTQLSALLDRLVRRLQKGT